MSAGKTIHKAIQINAPVSAVWDALTDIPKMKLWMAEPEIEVEIITDWKVGGPFLVKGFHHVRFENKGTVLKFEKEKVVAYSHLSSISRLPDKPESYTILEFSIEPKQDHTILTIDVSGFPMETIYQHWDFYWKATLTILKNAVEKGS